MRALLRFAWLLALLALAAGGLPWRNVGRCANDVPELRRVTLKFGPDEPGAFSTRRFLLSPEVVFTRDGVIRLARSSLVADEMGASDHHQNEQLSDKVWARKTLHLPVVYPETSPRGAELFIYGQPKEVLLNGNPLSGARRHESTGWTRVKLPVDAWKDKGEANVVGRSEHEVVLKGGGSVLFEPRERPGLSSRTSDSGQSWSSQALGARAASPGEYLVRLRWNRPARAGWARSPVFDLWAAGSNGPALPGTLHWLRASGSLFAGQFGAGDGGSRSCLMRTGSTPTPDEQSWTAWHSLLDRYEPKVAAAGHRWAQVRFLLSAGVNGPQPEGLPKQFELEYELAPAFDKREGTHRLIQALSESMPRQTSLPFVYQRPSPRLKLLREQYQLDKVIALGTDEMEQLMLLRHWVRNQWHTAWGTHPAAWMPPWDTLQILGCKDQPDCLTMCTHYACVFTQCCLALGWNARHCILDHHCVAEVWVDQHQKWAMMDAGNSKERPDCNLHFERNGAPLSALELHNAYRQKRTDGIVVRFTPRRLMEAIAPLCRTPPEANAPGSQRPDTMPVAELKIYPVCGLENYRRHAFPARNNYLESLYPGELYQGWAEYFYDGYWWVGDERDDPQLSPEYSRHLPPSRPQDIDWDLNWTRIHLCRTSNPGELRVDLETSTPNLERLERQVLKDGKELWQPTPASFTWTLQPGKNLLRGRGVNAWGRAGKEGQVEVEWQK